MDALLVKIAQSLGDENSSEVLRDWLDELEFVYDALGEEEQGMCTQLTEQVMKKLEGL